MAIVAIANQKGGVGKTSLVLNLGWAYAEMGYHVLLADLDPQGHLTAVFGDQGAAGLGGFLEKQEAGARPIASGIHLLGMESGSSRPRDPQATATAIEALAAGYEVVLLDCPPSDGLLLQAAFKAANALLIPLHPDYLSMNGLSRFIRFTQSLEGTKPFHLVLNRVSKRRRLDDEVRARLLAYFGERLLHTGIREAIAIAESPGFGQSLFQYAPGHGALADYRAVARELQAALAWPQPRNGQLPSHLAMH